MDSKSMTQETGKMQPWQVFHAGIRTLGVNMVARIFNRKIRSAYDWAQDPSYTECRCKSPLELLHTYFERLADSGREYVVEAAIQYLRTSIDHGERSCPIVEPLPTMNEEILADYSAVATLQQAIGCGRQTSEIMDLAVEAKAEIDRTVALYVRDHGGDR